MTLNPKGTEELLRVLKIGDHGASDMEAAAALARAEAEGSTDELRGVAAELADLRAAMKAPKPNPEPST